MRREIDFIKCNPTQNMTILVQTQHSVDEYPRIATRLVSYDSVHAEQVGFIEKPYQYGASAHLHMAGGEFCGNACMPLPLKLERQVIAYEGSEWSLVVIRYGDFFHVVIEVNRFMEL